MISRLHGIFGLVAVLCLLWGSEARADCDTGAPVANCDSDGEALQAATSWAAANPYTPGQHFAACVFNNNPGVYTVLRSNAAGECNGSNVVDANGTRTWSSTIFCGDLPSYSGFIEQGVMVEGEWPDTPPEIPVSCNDGCTVIADGPIECAYNDNDGDGTATNGDTYLCSYNFSYSDNSTCNGGADFPNPNMAETPPTQEGPEAPNYDCTNVQCGPGGEDSDPGGGVPDLGGGPGGPGEPDPDPDDPNFPSPDEGDEGDSCQSFQENCFNDQGDQCGIADTGCTYGPAPHEGDDGVPANCDPAVDPDGCMGAQSASTSSDCKSAPACSGNIIQCAVLKQSWKAMCAIQDLGGESAPWKPGGDADYGRDLASADERTEIDLSAGVDSAGFAGGSCPADIVVDVLGLSLTIQTQPICDVAGVVRFFVIISSLLWAGAFVVRAF